VNGGRTSSDTCGRKQSAKRSFGSFAGTASSRESLDYSGRSSATGRRISERSVRSADAITGLRSRRPRTERRRSVSRKEGEVERRRTRRDPTSRIRRSLRVRTTRDPNVG
jgi:hypothetical protein